MWLLSAVLALAVGGEPEGPLELHVFSMPLRKCPPCLRFHNDSVQEPLFSTLKQFKVTIWADCDENHPECRQRRVTQFPTFLLLRDGRPIRRQTGYFGASGLKDFLQP